MSQIISYQNLMVRINPAKNCIEYSNNRGSSWYQRYSGSSCGVFSDLILYGNEIIAATSKGIYYSNNGGSSWYQRYSGSSCGQFLSLMDGGRELLANTTKGLYYSNNRGSSWYKRS